MTEQAALITTTDRLIALTASAAVARIGAAAPDFEMPSTRNLERLDQPVRLSDYNNRWLVLFFYPLDFTFVCPTEITAFSDASDRFAKIGA
ncbi:MAG TPA: redoxin domain-containing protein, partial [Candidatus Polarisedimenticolia bacterium]|nr:redoxin domain-containing protein [Candidatus Polarisedimenticolia bacterium]